MKASPKASSRRAFWLRLAGTILTIALLIYLLGEQGWDEILRAIREIAPWQLLLALLAMVGSRLAVCSRWYILLRGTQMDITFGQSSRITLAGLFASNFLPTTIGGDVVRLAGAVQLRFDSAISTASLVVDRLIGMAGMAMALPFGIPAFNAAVRQAAWESRPSPVAGAAAVALSGRLGSLWKKWSALARFFLSRLLQALSQWVSHPGTLLGALAATWVHQLCLYTSMGLLLAGMGEPISFWLLAGLWSVVYFITLLPFSINGYGLQEVSLAFVFTRVGGISAASALSLALLVRTLTMLVSIPGAAFVPGIMAGRHETRGSDIPQSGSIALDQDRTSPVERSSQQTDQ